MENQAVYKIKSLQADKTILKLLLVLSMGAIMITAVEAYKFGFYQGGIYVVNYATKMAETAAQTAVKAV